MTSDNRRLALAAREDSLPEFDAFAASQLAAAPLDGGTRERIVEALGGALSGIVRAAADHSSATAHPIELGFALDAGRLTVTIAEAERNFDEVSDAEFASEADRVREQEFSMRSLCKLFDEVRYAFRRGMRNELELVRFV